MQSALSCVCARASLLEFSRSVDDDVVVGRNQADASQVAELNNRIEMDLLCLTPPLVLSFCCLLISPLISHPELALTGSVARANDVFIVTLVREDVKA